MSRCWFCLYPYQKQCMCDMCVCILKVSWVLCVYVFQGGGGRVGGGWIGEERKGDLSVRSFLLFLVTMDWNLWCSVQMQVLGLLLLNDWTLFVVILGLCPTSRSSVSQSQPWLCNAADEQCRQFHLRSSTSYRPCRAPPLGDTRGSCCCSGWFGGKQDQLVP